MASTNFINECKNPADENRIGKITLTDGTIIDRDNYLVTMTIEDSCVVDNQIIGATYEKTLTAELLDTPSDMELDNVEVTPSMGVVFEDETEEDITYDKYTIEEITNETTANMKTITAYDKFHLLDQKYDCTLDFGEETTTDEETGEETTTTTIPHTIFEFFIDCLTQLDLTTDLTSITNGTLEISANPFTNDETIRTVLSEIEKVSCSIMQIDWSTNKVTMNWLDITGEPTYEFTTDDYTELEGGITTFGPVNSLVIGLDDVEGENITREDSESIETYGETQIEINSDYFLYNADLRAAAIDNIWNKIHNFQYVETTLTALYGKPFLKIGDKIRVNLVDGSYYDTYVLKHTLTYNGYFTSVIEAPALTKGEVTVKNTVSTGTSVSEVIRATQIVVNKQDATITSLTSKTTDLDSNYQDVLTKFESVPTLAQYESYTTQVEQLQTDTYTKTDIKKILTGENVDGTKVTYVETTSGTFDENGMHYAKTGAETNSTINEVGVSVNDSDTNEEVLFAGYDEDLGESVVRTKNVYVRKYFNINDWRLEQTESDEYGVGVGWFYTGGNS